MLRFLLLIFSLILGINSYGQQTVGLFFNDSAAYNGYTLISPNSSKSDYLIDNCGRVINSWTSQYVHGESAYLLENGNLLRTCRLPSNFPSGGTGGRIEMYNWNGNLIWGYNYSTDEYHHHHDLEMLPNGNILLIAWEAHSNSEAQEAGRNPALTGNNGVWATQIVEIEPVGTNQANIIWKWRLWDHLVQDFDSTKANYGVIADHPELVDINFEASSGGLSGGADWIHANAVDYNPELDQIIINSRVFNEFWIIDHSTTTEEAATGEGGNSGKGGDILYRWGNPQSYDRGNFGDQKFYGQHDAQWIAQGYPDEGKIMVYNNGVGRPNGNYSSIDIFVPPVDSEGNYQIEPNQPYGPSNIFWSYDGQPNNSFFSSNISGANRLPNGNTIVCVGREGHIFELDSDDNIVWDYINPVTPSGPVSQGNPINNNSVFRAYRYGVDYPAFEGRDLTPGEPIELNPFASDCQIFDGTVAVSEAQVLDNINILENPFNDLLTIENESVKQLHIQIVDLMGRVVFFEKSSDQIILLETNDWTPGLYVLRISDPGFKQFYIQKIIKQ